jgi:hypothetical protein
MLPGIARLVVNWFEPIGFAALQFHDPLSGYQLTLTAGCRLQNPHSE